jgi:acylphosphatase
MAEAERFLVSGRVQGVGYRAFARREAEALGLSGHAMNLPDGRVEVLAIGDAAARERLSAALARGPVLARVIGIERCPAEADPTGRFATG